MNRNTIILFAGAALVVALAAVSVDRLLFSGGDTLSGSAEIVNLEDRVSLDNVPAGGVNEKREVIRFGFDLRASPEEDARQYLPFLKYLERTTGYTFELRFSRRDDELHNDLGNGIVDLAAVGAVSFIRAQRSYGVVPLVRGLNSEDKGEYQSVIVVAPDSHIKSLADLQGARLAFGSINSTQGHLIPRIVLTDAGIGLGDLAGHVYTGSHQKCASAVIAGTADACGMQDTMGRNLAKRNKVRIIYTSPLFPSSGIAASPTLPRQVLEKIRQALVDFQPLGRDREGLYNWQRTEMPNGFTAASVEDYRVLEAGMKTLGLMK